MLSTSQIPNSLTESCACSHPYFAHEGSGCNDPSHPNYPFRRGASPLTNCGGFASSDEHWTFSTNCACLATLMSHNLVETPVTSRPTGGVSIGPSSTPLPPTLTTTLPPPIQAYRGVPPVVQGSVGTRRTASAQRTLPQHQAAGTATGRGSRRSYPSGPSPFSANVEVRVVLWPMVIRGLHEPAGHGTVVLKARNDDMLTIITRLRAHGLVVPVSVPRTGLTPPEDFTAQLSAALQQSRLVLRESPAPTSDAAPPALTDCPWALLSSTRRGDVISFHPHPTININVFGIEEFTRLAKKFTSPDPAEAGVKLLWASPRFGHVIGPIEHSDFATQDLPTTGRSLLHSCCGPRIIDGLPLAGNVIYADAACLAGYCPVDEPARLITPPHPATPPPAPPASLIRPRASSLSSPTLGRRVRPRAPSLDRPASPMLRPIMPAPPVFPPALQAHEMPALIDGRDMATFRTVASFFDGVRVEAGRVIHPFTRRLDIHALTIDAAARFLVPLLVEVDAHASLDLEPPITLTEGIRSCSYIRSAASFFKAGHSIEMYVVLPPSHLLPPFNIQTISGVTPQGDHLSFGPGPERAVHRRAIALAMEDYQLWQQAPNSQYMVPKFTPGDVAIPSRNTLFKAHGSLLAIHCYTLACGPHPVSIWLLVALIMGPSAMLLLRNYLAALDPVAFNCLTPWFMFGPADDLPTHFLHPFNQFLMNVMDIQPSMIESPRTEDVHDSWTILFVTKVLFNDTEIWKRPEFASIRRGFDVAFGTTTFIAELTKHREILPLLVRIYDREVRQPADIVSKLSESILMRAVDNTTPFFGALFRLLMLRYLGGTGHPEATRGGLVSEDDFVAGLNDASLRARLLLQTTTDSNMMPSRESWRILWRFIGLNNTAPESIPRPVHFHTCTYDVDVKITVSVQELLLKSCTKLDDREHTTPFDVWFHGQLLSRDHNTA
ncbi:hypothetical protein C8R46DRAFT_1029151 [Mycena filopes]|nr:hypothetical protein C8R46DRAFT_1029151 [Mycena filopes]